MRPLLRVLATASCFLPLLAMAVSFRYLLTEPNRGCCYTSLASAPVRQVAALAGILFIPRSTRPGRLWVAIYLWGWLAWFGSPL